MHLHKEIGKGMETERDRRSELNVRGDMVGGWQKPRGRQHVSPNKASKLTCQ